MEEHLKHTVLQEIRGKCYSLSGSRQNANKKKRADIEPYKGGILSNTVKLCNREGGIPREACGLLE